MGERSRAGGGADVREITYDSHDAFFFSSKRKGKKSVMGAARLQAETHGCWSQSKRSRPRLVVLNDPPDVSGCQPLR